ncbi:hypothetical protein M8C21_014414 [Ambrosia artemisiifolia]|uniref:Ribosomal protein L2 n=1 Tax=Ambrosia artemisiifolia TaxID=4212 RepID=A0AAD5GE69_AMBAR|nr:hypothetical protein M8C21_014414 [Ambrosia artemisiifolia]
MPLGTTIDSIEITLGKGGQLARAAGAIVKLICMNPINHPHEDGEGRIPNGRNKSYKTHNLFGLSCTLKKK